jgi:aspartyl-tRNA(Asn)/glutamyl-tRNA(Gln) amidotransferase subunit A
MTQLIGLGISELKDLLSKKAVSSLEILQAHQAHIARHESQIKAFNCLTGELAEQQAKKVDALIAKGEPLSPLAGIPVAVKDNMCVPGYATTCSSKILENFVPTYECTAVSRLFEAGAVCVGKTNMDEFAMGSSTENSAFSRTYNPWNVDYVPGGSSGGSAAAVAAGFSTIALGSDTGGSIRLPASFCGVVGMKPTYGMVSRFGLVAYASSLDQIGPIAGSVEDTAIVLSVIAGSDKRDSTSLPNTDGNANTLSDIFELAAQIPSKSAEQLAHGLRVGIIKELVGEGIDAEVKSTVHDTCELLSQLGATVEEVSIPNVKYALPVYYLIATAEASANLSRFDGVRYGYRDSDASDILSMYMSTRQAGFGAEVKRRIMLGTYALSTGYYDAYYKKAQQVRRLIKADFDKAFNKFDLLISPTSPTVAFQFGEKTSDPLTMYLTDIATIPANLAGLPGISLPAGLSSAKLPIGIQILGNTLSDVKVLQLAAALEKSTKFHKIQSPVIGAAI